MTKMWKRHGFTPWRIRGDERTPFVYTEVCQVNIFPERKTTVRLSGRLPAERELFLFRTGDILELRHGACGPRNRYEESDPAFRLTVWDVTLQMNHLNPPNPDDQAASTVDVELVGKWEVLDWELE